MPKDATFDGSTFAWSPEEGQAGAYLVSFVADNGEHQVKTDTVITVNREGENEPPELIDVFDEHGFEGESITFTAQAEDPEGDKVLFDFKGLPDGASFDRRTGEFTWTPGYTDARKYFVAVIAEDADDTSTAKIIIDVENRSAARGKAREFFARSDQSFDFCMSLRSPSAQERAAALEYLEKTPTAFRAAHVARLIHDKRSAVRSQALLMLRKEKDSKEFLNCFYREMAGKVWQLTDNKDTLNMLRSMLKSARSMEWSSMQKKALAAISKDLHKAARYNAYRERLREKRDREEAEEVLRRNR
jgi:hypothetical protein